MPVMDADGGWDVPAGRSRPGRAPSHGGPLTIGTPGSPQEHLVRLVVFLEPEGDGVVAERADDAFELGVE
jgi:hypothetical protein